MAKKPVKRAARKAPAPAPTRRAVVPAAERSRGGIKVRALRMGYYDHSRRREGDVFVIADEADFSEKWMVRVNPKTPERLTTAKTALEQEHGRIAQEKAGEQEAEGSTGVL